MHFRRKTCQNLAATAINQSLIKGKWLAIKYYQLDIYYVGKFPAKCEESLVAQYVHKYSTFQMIIWVN